MKRAGAIAALGALLGTLGGVVTASPALAGGRGAQWQPFPNEPFTLDASFCGFKVLWDAPVNKAFIQIFKLSDWRQ
jgi:hypothetical protein